MSKPEIIAIEHDNDHAQYIGRMADGSQFFLTTPFVPALRGSPGREFIALYLFDARGRFREARIDDLGTRAEMNREFANRLYHQRLAELGAVDFCRIEVLPFQIERFGTIFGLVPRPPEEEEDDWWVTVEPGNYMAFHEPWDSGEYDT